MLLVVMDLRPLLSLTLGSFINKRAGIAQLVERNLAKVEKASLYQVFLFSQLPIETQ